MKRWRVGPNWRLWCMVATLAAWATGSAHAQVVRDNFPVTNGPVYATVLSGDTLYIAGDFTQVGPATGGGVPIDAASGALVSGFPKVTGGVYAAVSDGAGGWYIGGGFNAVGGIPRSNLAHVLANMSVSPWNPGCDNTVWAMAISGSTIYLGGDFTNVGGQARSHIAALDATSGNATAFDPNATGSPVLINTLTLSGTMLYVGGFFTGIGGQPRTNIAALNTALDTNNATAWNPGVSGPPNMIKVNGSTIYVAGSFSTLGGQSRSNVGAVDGTTGLATAWNPNSDGFTYDLEFIGSTVYTCGSFSTIGGQTRHNIAALDATTGLATAWDPNANSTIQGLARIGNTIYAGGLFTSIGGQSRNRLAALDATVNTNNALAWDPNTNNGIIFLDADGSTVYAGGAFTSFGGSQRNHAAAIGVTSGTVLPWNPNVNDRVNALALSGSTMYLGGRFSSVGGQTRFRIAAVDATSGAVTAWNPVAGNSVLALATSGTTVYAGGLFTSIGGQTRNHIAALDGTINTSMATAWNPNAGTTSGNVVNALAISGTTVYAGGMFTTIGGQSRGGLAALDATINTSMATAWNPALSFAVVNALLVSGTTVYVGGGFSSIGGQTRSDIAALDATVNTNMATAWNPGADGPISALALYGNVLYAGGNFGNIGGAARLGMAALDLTTNTNNATAWNVDATSYANSFSVGSGTIYIGGFSGRLGIHPQTFLAAVGAGTAAVPETRPGRYMAALQPNEPNPFALSTRVRFSLAAPATVSLAVYDLAGREIASLLRNVRLEAGPHEAEFQSRGLPSGVYTCRLSAGGRAQTRRLVHIR